MPSLSLLASKALLLASFASASPQINKLLQAELPIDPKFIRPVTVLPQIITVPISKLENQFHAATAAPVNAPFVGTLHGVTAENATIDKRLVGADDRRQYTDRNYPFRTVGKLIWTNGVYCSAFTQGPRSIVAAKHCIPPSGVGATFYPAIDNNDAPFGSFPITTVITNTYPRDSSSCDWEYDWAVFIVNAKVGNTVGWMGIKAPDPALIGKNILYNLGYPGDKDNGQRPYRQMGITGLTQYESNSGFNCDSEPYVPLCSDQDTAGGQSGSPIWEYTNDQRYVWGVASVSSSTNTAHGSGKALVQAVINARNTYT